MISCDAEKIKKQFETDFQNSKKNNASYRQIMEGIISDYNITADKFMRKTHLSKSTYYNLIEGKRKPDIETVVALAVVFRISLRNIENLLRAGGLGFKHTSRVHHAYTQLIERHSGKSITECNKVLEKMGILQEAWLKDPYNYVEYKETIKI
jgi:transcriptional regulator with XRE-family HTH domain